MSNVTALLVGVCTYYAKVDDLPFCKNDVQAVKEALISGLNVSEDKIITCGQSGVVTIDDLFVGLNTSISKTEKEDTFIFYFSGHGGKNTLVLSNYRLNLQSLIGGIERISAKNKVIILDSCHSGDFVINDRQPLDLTEMIETFVGHGYAVLASCGAEEKSGFESKRQLSTYTSFLVDALTSRFLIREGKKSLESINEAIFHFARMWNNKNSSYTQTPIFRSNIGGTIFFDVEEYTPYHTTKVYEETDTYIIYEVAPVHTAIAKRLSAKVILRYKSSIEEIAYIANEVKEKIKDTEVYPNALSEFHHGGKSANIIWCYFGYSEDDIVDSNYICHSIWVDDTQDKNWWYKENKNSRIVNNICLEINPSYKMINTMLHKEVANSEDLIKEINAITEKLINAAENFIKLYREYQNGVIDETDLIDAVEPLNCKIADLFLQQSNLPYPPKELHEWANAYAELAGTIYDFSLYYNKKNIDKWTSETKIYLMNSSIKRYENDLEKLRILEKNII